MATVSRKTCEAFRSSSVLRGWPARRTLYGRGGPYVIRYRDVGSVVVTEGCVELGIGAPTPALVTAVLLVQLNRWVWVERLIDVLCGEHAAAGQESAVESRVRRLCEVLEPGRTTSESPRLRLRGTGGYRLVAGPGDVARSGPPARRRRRLTRVSGGRDAWAAAAAREGLEPGRGRLGVMRGAHTREDAT